MRAIGFIAGVVLFGFVIVPLIASILNGDDGGDDKIGPCDVGAADADFDSSGDGPEHMMPGDD